ncbi:MAG: O-antigen ligase family protein [Henriciella sp.]
MSLGPKSFAPFLATALVVWPIMAYIGAQGFTGSVGIAALIGLAYVRVRRVEIYAVAGLAFATWVVISTFWAPEAQGFLTGDLLEGSFSLDIPGVRFGLTALAGLGVLVAVGLTRPGGADLSLKVILAAAIVQFIGVIVTALFMPQILEAMAPRSDPVTEMPQNLMRNANAFALLLPFLLAWIWFRGEAEYWPFVSIAIGVLAIGAFAQTGTQTALTGAAFMLICMGIVKLMPKNGFKLIFTSLAFYVVAAPALVGWGVTQLRLAGLPLPKSFFSRTHSWELVGTKIGQAPIIGHGPEASHTWRDTFGDHPAWLDDAAARYGDAYAWEVYPVIPIHPHNMPLQVWAETGMVGALLAAAFLFLVGWRLKPPTQWSPIARYGGAGLVGVCVAITSFAYSMWNEAFWASVILAAAIILLQARHDGPVKE